MTVKICLYYTAKVMFASALSIGKKLSNSILIFNQYNQK